MERSINQSRDRQWTPVIPMREKISNIEEKAQKIGWKDRGREQRFEGGREGGRDGTPTLSARPKRSMEVTRARRSFRLQFLKPSSIRAFRSSCQRPMCRVHGKGRGERCARYHECTSKYQWSETIGRNED